MSRRRIAHSLPWSPGALAVAVAVGALASPLASMAQPTVVFDGSLGTAGPAPTVPLPGGGVDYRIADTDGRQVGPALFHSFAELRVREGDAASFTGPGAIDQIFARVTGGEASRIDGLLRSEIGSADLWVLNPEGIVFGRGARLDVDGSFHAATADELRFANGEAFEARAGGEVPTLVVAPPTAFGFLGKDAAPIAVEGELAVPKGETLSLVGGAIEIAGGTLEAPGGRIDVAGVASAGEVVRGGRDAAEPLDVSSFSRLAPVTIGPGSQVDVSGDPPGVVAIRGGEVVIDGAEVLALNRGASDPGGRISLGSDASVTVRGQALLQAGTRGRGGAGGDIEVRAPKLEIDNAIVASEVGRSVDRPRPSQGGTIRIRAGSVVLRDGGALSADAQSGAAGSIEVKARSLELTKGGAIHADGGDGEPDAGTVRLDVWTLWVSGTASGISANSQSGEAGTIEVTARNWVRLSNEGGERLALSRVLTGPTLLLTGLFAASLPSPDGRDDPASGAAGGSITIRAPEIIVGEGAIVATTSLGPRDAGDVVLRGGRIAVVDGGLVDSSAFFKGAAGTVSLDATNSIRA